MNELHHREEAIFDAAMELPPGQRAAHLDHVCAGDAALRQRVESLLKAGDSSCGFLDSPTDPTAAQTINVLPASFERAGDRIGRYKLLQQIGEGGCGVVYMAEQEEPVQRRVALKVIKLGLDTKSVIARFEAERQALALMDHPNIAKIYDAGVTDTPLPASGHPLPSSDEGRGQGEGTVSHPRPSDGRGAGGEGNATRHSSLVTSAGRPYFVMELVRGMKITDYCDEAKLSTNARLDLFIQVCQAIQHAHQKGIIHRDIKPSNVLVTINDGVPVPKVIDFGVAKATGGLKLTNKTVFTAFEQFIGTPAYMSPEQAVLTSLDIDTRSDIYALGVLLYEMLTGKTPFDAQELLAIGLDEMRRTIREQEPPRPSTRLSTLAQNELSTTAQRRGIEAPKLVSELRGDLDWIVMKALEKDRARRYETANGLASDIQRHLKNEPVVACPPSRVYRLQKMVRRNKVAFAAGSAVAVSLVVGLTLSTILFFRERATRKRADEQTAIVRTVNDFLGRDLLGQADSGFQVEAGFTPNPNLTVREAVEHAAERIGDRFKDQPLQEAELRYVIASVFLGLGQPEQAVGQMERSVDLARANLGLTHPRTVDCMNWLAAAYLRAGKVDQALALFEETLKLRKASLGPEHRDTLGSMNNLALAYRGTGKGDQAMALYEQTLKLMNRTLRPDDPFRLNLMANLAVAYRGSGKLDQAVSLIEQTVKLRREKLGTNHPATLNSMNDLALGYQELGEIDKALSLCEETVKLRKVTLGPDHPDTLSSMDSLAEIYLNAGRFDQALPLFQELLKLKKAQFGPDDLRTLKSMDYLAETFARMKNYAEADALYRNALNHLRLASSNAPRFGVVLHHLADVLREQKKSSEARPFAEEAMALYRRHPDWPANEGRHALAVLEAVLKDLGDSRSLEALRPEKVEVLRAAAEKGDVVALNDLAWLLATCSDSAIRDGRNAVDFAERAVAKTERKDAAYLDTLAAACAEAGDFARAVSVQNEAIALLHDEKEKKDYESRLKLYQSNSPYREP